MDTKNYLMEFIGAFFLVFAVGMVTLIPGAGSIAPFVVGLTLLLMITIGGRISGGHYNPAVTLACLLKGDVSFEKAVYYWIFQLIGAGVASFIVLFLKDYPVTVSLSVSIWHVFIVEFIYTFALVFCSVSYFFGETSPKRFIDGCSCRFGSGYWRCDCRKHFWRCF